MFTAVACPVALRPPVCALIEHGFTVICCPTVTPVNVLDVTVKMHDPNAVFAANCPLPATTNVAVGVAELVFVNATVKARLVSAGVMAAPAVDGKLNVTPSIALIVALEAFMVVFPAATSRGAVVSLSQAAGSMPSATTTEAAATREVMERTRALNMHLTPVKGL
jgi:hypothetical protein